MMQDESGEILLLPEAECWLGGAELPETLAVAWSGGGDSTALLLALHACGYDVRAWHVDHGWHADSAGQAETLRQRAAAWRIPFHSARIDTSLTANREAEARYARYRQFALWHAEQGIDALCLAHHLDDQAETVCMRMLQGAGAGGCRGMRGERSMAGGLRLLRPLLHVPKCELEASLQRAGVVWLEDASNRDTSLLRNHIRHRLFPAMQGREVDPARLWLRWQHQAERIAGQLDREADTVPLERRPDSVTVAWGEWAYRSAPVRACVLQRMMRALFGGGASLGRRHIVLVERWMAEGGRGGVDLSRSRLSRRDGFLRLDTVEASLCRPQS